MDRISNSRKILKIATITLGSILGLLIAFVLLACLVLFLSSTHTYKVSKSPDRIVSKANLRLPEYTVTNSSVEENPITAWIDVKYSIVADEPMDDRFVNRLDHLVQKNDAWLCEVEGQIYHYHMYKNYEDGPRINIVVDVEAGRVEIIYGFWNYKESIPEI